MLEKANNKTTIDENVQQIRKILTTKKESRKSCFYSQFMQKTSLTYTKQIIFEISKSSSDNNSSSGNNSLDNEEGAFFRKFHKAKTGRSRRFRKFRQRLRFRLIVKKS